MIKVKFDKCYSLCALLCWLQLKLMVFQLVSTRPDSLITRVQFKWSKLVDWVNRQWISVLGRLINYRTLGVLCLHLMKQSEASRALGAGRQRNEARSGQEENGDVNAIPLHSAISALAKFGVPFRRYDLIALFLPTGIYSTFTSI